MKDKDGRDSIVRESCRSVGRGERSGVGVGHLGGKGEVIIVRSGRKEEREEGGEEERKVLQFILSLIKEKASYKTYYGCIFYKRSNLEIYLGAQLTCTHMADFLGVRVRILFFINGWIRIWTV